MLVLAINTVLYAKLSNQEEIIMGIPIAARRHSDLQQIIGMFVNTLAARSYPQGNKKMIDFLREVKENLLEAFENQEYPFEDLVEKVSLHRDMSRNPLFDVLFVLQNLGDQAHDLPDPDISSLKIKPYKIKSKISKFDLALICFESEGRLICSWEYCTKLFKEETIHRFIKYFNQVVDSVIHQVTKPISRIEIITQGEKKQVLFEFNDTAREYPAAKTLDGLFAEQLEKSPDRVAVIDPEPGKKFGLNLGPEYSSKGKHLSYSELNRNANQIAHLLQSKGITTGTIAALLVERSLEMVIGMLGILQAGGAYMPMDPAYPRERLHYMLADTRTRVLVTTLTTPGHDIDFKGEILDVRTMHQSPPGTGLAPDASANRSCYVIYTSGSTGRPKGVLVCHQGCINLVYYHQEVFGESQGDRISQVSGPAFDAMVSEVWPCLLNGAVLVIADDETRTGISPLKEWLIKYQVTISFQSTIIAGQLIKEKWPQQGIP